MRLFIYANEDQEKEIRTKPVSPDVRLFFSPGLPVAQDVEKYDAFFILDELILNFNMQIKALFGRLAILYPVFLCSF